MKSNFVKLAVIAATVGSLSACVVAPQPTGYRMTSSVLPTYVNGQYIGMQPSNYIPPAQVTTVAANTAPAAPATTTQQPAPAPSQPAPVYLQSTTPSVVYVQAPAPVYNYNPYPAYYPPSYYPYGAYPYYSPYYVNPWFGGIGIGVGLGVRVRIR